jgi:hypothetical protein
MTARRPRPRPGAAAEESGPVPKPAPAAAPRPAALAPARPAPAASPTANPRPGPRRRTRTERRRQRDVERRATLRRRIPHAVGWTSVVVGVVLFVVVFNPNDTTTTPAPSAAAHTGTPAPTATARGANLADPAVVSAFLGGAASDIAAVTSYDYRNLDDALSVGLAVTTGNYRAAYRAALTGDLASTALAQHVVHTFDLVDLGIGAITANGSQAKVLVFGRQSVVDDSTGTQPLVTPVTLCATIHRSGDRFLISDLVEGASAGLPPGGPDLRVAAEVGRSEVVNLLSYRRADFDLDLQRALAGATVPLSDDIQSNAASTRAAMISGHYDLSATVTAIAVKSTSAGSVTLLVAADANRVPDGAVQPVLTHPRYEVTVTRTLQGWAASAVTPVDGS